MAVRYSIRLRPSLTLTRDDGSWLKLYLSLPTYGALYVFTNLSRVFRELRAFRYGHAACLLAEDQSVCLSHTVHSEALCWDSICVCAVDEIVKLIRVLDGRSRKVQRLSDGVVPGLYGRRIVWDVWRRAER
jgi:hypothetical protein